MVGRELVALSVGEYAVGGAGDVAEMECDGSEAERGGVDFGVGQSIEPLGKIVEREIEGVEDGAGHGGDVGVRATEPGLDVGAAIVRRS